MQALRWLPGICGSLGPALIPPAHIAILWFFWQNYARYVDQRFCTCSCWDTVFKGLWDKLKLLCFLCITKLEIYNHLGTYESGIASYKHMYFNATQNTLKIWVLIVLGIIAMYECIKLLVFLIIQNKVRYSMVVLFGLSIFSHYYGWWAYINYYNDEYYSQWNHQLFFSVSVHIRDDTTNSWTEKFNFYGFFCALNAHFIDNRTDVDWCCNPFSK